jgi:hypothetical protein
MADRYRVTIEEDDGNGWIIGLIAGAIVIGLLIYALIYVGIPLLIGYIIYLIIKRNKKKKATLPTRCTQCRRNNALEHLKTEIVQETPVRQTIYSKDKRGAQDSITIIEYTHRKYEKCKFCGSISFSDTVKNSI